MKGLVYKSTGSWYSVKSDNGDVFNCKIKGKFRLENIDSTNPVVVGDFVEFIVEDHDQQEIGIIQKVYERRNYILRRSVNLSKQTHILASNIDFLLLVITLKNPITTTSFIDRFLVSAEAYSIKTLLIFNKCDIYNEKDEVLLNSLINIYDDVGYDTIKISANNIEIKRVKIDIQTFLKKYPLKIATETIGVKFGGWGINLARTNIRIKLKGRISLL